MKFSQIPYLKPDFEQLSTQMAAAIADFKNADNAAGQLAALKAAEDITAQFNTQYALVRIRHQINTNDQFYYQELQWFNQKAPILYLQYQELFAGIETSIFKREIIAKIGNVIMLNINLQQQSMKSEIIADIQEENGLVLEYTRLMAQLTVDFDNKTMPLSLLIPYKESSDRNLRKQAFITEGQSYNQVKEQLDDIFERLVKNRHQQAQKLGFDNYVPLGYARRLRNCYTNRDIAIFKEQVVQEIVPIVNQIYANRQKRLGLNNLNLYDLSLPFKEGAPLPQISGEQIINSGRQMYRQMSPATADFIDMMLDHELLDVYAKINKAPGGFCSYLADYNYPFIFANFNGTAADINVFTHEIGHAYAKYQNGLKSEKSYAATSMDISETHSMSMEFLTSPWHHLFFKEHTAKYQLALAENALIFIPYACQVDDFQEQIYLNPNLSPSQRDKLWLNLQSKYRPYIKDCTIPFYGDGAGWQRQSHIYKMPFYYIDYALAQIMALQFFAKFLKDQKQAYDLYFEFIGFGSQKTFIDLIKTLNLVSPLEKGQIKPIVRDLWAWIKSNQI